MELYPSRIGVYLPLFIFLGAFAVGAPAEDPDVEAAIDRGVAFLLRAIDGPKGFNPDNDYPAGYTAVQTYALLKCDLSLRHPTVEKGLTIIQGAKFSQVYTTSVTIMALGAAVDQLDDERKAGTGAGAARAKLLGRMQEALTWLLDARHRGEGVWSYHAPPPAKKGKAAKRAARRARADHSNTQFAVLALGVAAEKGLTVPVEVWNEVADHFIAAQDRDGAVVTERPVFRERAPVGAPRPGGGGNVGRVKTTARVHPLYADEDVKVRGRGWKYIERDPTGRFSMDCAGLSSLLLAQAGLAKGSGAGERGEALRRAIRDGYGIVTLRLRGDGAEEALKGPYGPFYHLYSLEKVADLGEIEAFGEHRWYFEGTRRLLGSQRPDGGWGPADKHAEARADTALALLFLSRATDLTGAARPLARVTSVGGAGAKQAPSGARWIYLPSQKAEVSLARLLRLFAYRPSDAVSKMVEEAVKDSDPERLAELAAGLARALDISPFPSTKTEAQKLLAQVAGVDLPSAKEYGEWAARYAETTRLGKSGDPRSVDRLRELLRSSSGTPLRVRIIWAIERTKGRAALGDLVDLLESPDPTLREAAHGGVVFFADQCPPFHPRGPEKQRADEVRAIREWLAGEGGATKR